MRKKNPKTNKQISRSYRTQAEVWPQLYTDSTGLYLLSPTWGHNGVFNSLYRTCDSVSRPDGRSYWTLRRRDWIFPEYLLGSLHFAARQKSRVQWSLLIRTVPALRCKIEILRAKGTFGVHFVAREKSCVQNCFKSNVRHPWEGSGPLLTRYLTGRRLRHSC